jgi:cysteine desulfurase/selenocysteine lyase
MGMRAAVEYLTALGMDAVESHEHALTGYALDQLALVPGVTVIGPTENVNRGSAISFTVEGLHPHDVGQVLDNRGIAVRVGHHCAWPTCRRFRVPATTRLSTYIYNDRSDIDAAVSGIVAAQEFFGVK